MCDMDDSDDRVIWVIVGVGCVELKIGLKLITINMHKYYVAARLGNKVISERKKDRST